LQSNQTPSDRHQLSQKIKNMGLELGFQQVGITDTLLDAEHDHYNEWIERNFHGEMSYMERNIDKRFYPDRLVPDTLSVICVRLDYYKNEGDWPINLLNQHDLAYVSRYALGRDYHKLIRKRLQQFANQISTIVSELGYRVFTDSAPVLEKALASSSERFSPTWCLKTIHLWGIIVAAVPVASMFAQPKRLLHPMLSMPGVVFHI
jgi:epoxyqueuosine reductase